MTKSHATYRDVVRSRDPSLRAAYQGLLAFARRTVSSGLHGLALALVVATAGKLAAQAGIHGWEHELGTVVFCVTAGIVFLVSSVYHLVHDGFGMPDHAIPIAETLDHIAIYLFIAGTYTPMLLRIGAPEWKYELLFGVWIIALCGVLYTVWRERFPGWMQSRIVYTGMFILMGWTFLIKAQDLLAAMSVGSIVALIAGGLSYTVGAIIYALGRPNPWPGFFGYHEIWHTCVLLGWSSHYVAIYLTY